MGKVSRRFGIKCSGVLDTQCLKEDRQGNASNRIDAVKRNVEVCTANGFDIYSWKGENGLNMLLELALFAHDDT